MTRYTVYVCDHCGAESKSFDEMEAHEAGHFGLNPKELHEWNSLKGFVRYLQGLVENRPSEAVRERLETATKQLKAFEEEHNLLKKENTDV